MKSPFKRFGKIFVFCFIFMWHCPGNNFTKVIWVWINCIVLYIEVFGKTMMTSRAYQKCSNILGERIMSILAILFGSQLLLISTLNTVLYLTPTHEIAMHIINELYFNNNLESYLLLTFVLYSVYCSCEFLFKTKRFKAKNN